jgi:hypothetical protein
MTEPREIEVTGLLDDEAGQLDTQEGTATVRAIMDAVKRAHHDERTTWLTYNGLRCAAIVPLEVGRVMDPDELPKPVMLPAPLTLVTPVPQPE